MTRCSSACGRRSASSTATLPGSRTRAVECGTWRLFTRPRMRGARRGRARRATGSARRASRRAPSASPPPPSSRVPSPAARRCHGRWEPRQR
eukprot:1482593-Prymnesium_polylepis.1